MITNLTALAEKYGTDKLNHGYMPFYEAHLPEEPKRILEIGVKDGASIKMWAEYFPNTEVHGLDLFVEYPMTEELISIPNVFLHKGDQCNWKKLEFLRKYNFDVIIDDGSHNARDQMMTFFGLFNGKHYFIEDLHCNNDEFYSQGLPPFFRANNIFDTNAFVEILDPYKIICINSNKDVAIQETK